MKTLFELTCCFKNTPDAEKAIEDHTFATHTRFSVYKTEKGIIPKANMQNYRKITKLICWFSFDTNSWNFLTLENLLSKRFPNMSQKNKRACFSSFFYMTVLYLDDAVLPEIEYWK